MWSMLLTQNVIKLLICQALGIQGTHINLFRKFIFREDYLFQAATSRIILLTKALNRFFFLLVTLTKY